jgi:hypothetical protein
MSMQMIPLGLFFVCLLTACAEHTNVKQNASGTNSVLDNMWRKMRVDGCTYIVSTLHPEAIVHAGNCPNHDSTTKIKGDKK